MIPPFAFAVMSTLLGPFPGAPVMSRKKRRVGASWRRSTRREVFGSRVQANGHVVWKPKAVRSVPFFFSACLP